MEDAEVPARVSFYRRGVLGEPYRRWFPKVCVHLLPPDEVGTTIGEIVSAYPTPSIKRGETQQWP